MSLWKETDKPCRQLKLVHWQVPRAIKHWELSYSSGGQPTLLWAMLAFTFAGVESKVVSRSSFKKLWKWLDCQQNTWEGVGMLLSVLTPTGHGAQKLHSVLCQLCGS